MNRHPNPNTTIGPLLTTREAATRLRVSTDYLLTLALRGEVASLKVGTRAGQRGGKRLYPESEIERWLSEHLRAA